MNERMTKRDADEQAMMDCEKCKADWTGKHGKPMADCTALYCRNRLLGRVVEYEDTGREPEEVTALGKLFDYALKESKTLTEQLTLLKHIRELAEADKDGRVVVLPCKVGERWTDEDGRAVRITAVIVSIEPFGTNINIYFDYEDATPDDAGSDCMANWDYFSRHYTCIEVERATEGAT